MGGMQRAGGTASSGIRCTWTLRVLRVHAVGALGLPPADEGEGRVGREVRAAERPGREALPVVGASERVAARVAARVGDDGAGCIIIFNVTNY